MIRKCLIVLVVCSLSVISIGCAVTPGVTKTAQAESKYVADFNYTPDSQTVPGSAGVTFTIAKVNYKVNAKDTKPWFMYPQSTNFNDAINQDLSEILIANGFSVSGPFDSYDLIPYSDKKAIDLFLAPTVELLITLKDRKETLDFWAVGPIYDLSGGVEVNGKINLELREIVTNELMWAKSIPFAYAFPYNLRISKYVPSADANSAPFNYALIMDDVAKGIEQQYPNLMATIAKLIDPEEMRIIKKQTQELKSKKGY